MAVAYDQIDQLIGIIGRYVPPEQVQALLKELAMSRAAQNNKSFAETICRILERVS